MESETAKARREIRQSKEHLFRAQDAVSSLVHQHANGARIPSGPLEQLDEELRRARRALELASNALADLVVDLLLSQLDD